MPGQRPVIRMDRLGRWWCVTEYAVGSDGEVTAHVSHDVTARIHEIVSSNLAAAAMNSSARRN